MGHMGVLRMAEGYVLINTCYVTFADHDLIIVSNLRQKTVKDRDVTKCSSFSYNLAVVLSACYPSCSAYRSPHHHSTPIHTLSVPCPSHNPHHFHYSLTTPLTTCADIPPQHPHIFRPTIELCTLSSTGTCSRIL